MSVRIINADVFHGLAQLEDESVQMVCTSPPYYGLRDYGVEGQIGLEATPDEFVEKMVAVFREVKRVLRNDGVLFLNIGDSYCSTDKWGGGGDGKNGKQTLAPDGSVPSWAVRRRREPIQGVKPKDLFGIPWMTAFALRQPYVDWQIKSEAMRGWVAGMIDGEGCITISKTKSSHCESFSFPPRIQVRMTSREPLERLAEVAGSKVGADQLPPSHLAAQQRMSWSWVATADRAAKIIAEIYPFLTCKRKQAIVAWNHQMFRAARGNQERKAGEIEKEEFCKQLINDLNQRRDVDLPSWMIEPKIVEEKGWYLRQELIWAKPNPMPESVTDRCTKAHEHIFLLSKGSRYFYDAEAIREDALTADLRRPYAPGQVDSRGNGHDRGGGNLRKVKVPGAWDRGEGAHGTIHRDGRTSAEYQDAPIKLGKNKRSVWTISTEGYAEAHFATFPQELPETCIKAGSRIGDVVLDPFGGAGTTGLVADKLGRNAVLIELNPEYAAMAERRIQSSAPLFAQVETTASEKQLDLEDSLSSNP